MSQTTKLPKKGSGVTATYEGMKLHCLEDGEYKGIPKFVWAHEDGSRAFRKVNGNITFVRPGEATQSNSSPSVNWPTLDSKFSESIVAQIDAENLYVGVAVEIAKGRYPNLSSDSQTFGMIVNAIKTHLIELRK